MCVRLLQCCVCPLHVNQLRRSAGDAVGGVGDDVGVRHVRFDVENRRAVEQIDTRDEQAIGFDLVQFHHGLANAIRAVGGASGEDAHGLVAAEPGRAHFQARFVFQGLVEQEQQPDVTDLFQTLHGVTLIERRHQFQHATGGGRQLRLAGDGELLLEAGADEADGGDAVSHGLKSETGSGRA